MTTTAARDQTPTSRPELEAISPGPRRSGRLGFADPLSDRTTSALIRRVLCPKQLADKGRSITPAPIEELLPPLTSRNDVDHQLYAIIAIVLREFVQNWYNKITPDEAFVAEIVQIIAHCTRALEQRLRKVDLESLLLDELPELLDRHVKGKKLSYLPTLRQTLLTAAAAYRAAHTCQPQAPIQADARQVYHSLCPLPSMSPVPQSPQTAAEQADNETAYRQLLIRGVLAVLLPTEDLDNDCLAALVGQIFSELILGSVVARKASEPWLIWEGLIVLCRLVREKTTAMPASLTPTVHPSRPSKLRHGWWAIVQVCFTVLASIKLLAAALSLGRSLPSRRPSAGESTSKSARGVEIGDNFSRPALVPVVAFRLWPTLSSLFEMDLRMPWVCGTLSWLQWVAVTGPGRVAGVDGVVDRYAKPSLTRAIRPRCVRDDACTTSHWTSRLPPLSIRQARTARECVPQDQSRRPRKAPSASSQVSVSRGGRGTHPGARWSPTAGISPSNRALQRMTTNELSLHKGTQRAIHQRS
jgi:hypothetical protein